MTYYIVYGIVAFFVYYLIEYFRVKSSYARHKGYMRVYDIEYNIDNDEVTPLLFSIAWPVFLIWLSFITIDHIMKKLINFFASKS